MEDVSHAIEDDVPPPLPPRENVNVHTESNVSRHSSVSQMLDDTQAESGSGYVYETSFERKVFIR